MQKWKWSKLLFYTAFLVILGMIYWSSSLVEADLKSLKKEIKDLRSETASLSQKLRRELQTHLSQTPTQATSEEKKPQESSHYPNLLQEDPYYTETLPKTLDKNFQAKGILRQAIIGRPEHLHPFNAFRDVNRMIDLCTVQLAQLKFGKYETLAPDMALKIEARPRSDLANVHEYWIHLRKDAFWQPLNQDHFPSNLKLAPIFFEKHPVTAHDFKFYYDAVMNSYVSEAKAVSLRTYYQDIEELVVIDDYTFVVRWKPHKLKDESYKVKYSSLNLTGSLQPLARFVYQYFADGKKILEEDADPESYRKSSIWAQNFMHHFAKNVIVSCGPYIFNGMNDEGISFRKNHDHYNLFAALLEGIQFRFKESFDAVWQDFKAGKIDFCTLSPNQLSELDLFLESEEYKAQRAKHRGIRHIDYVDTSYYYIGWNESKPFFSNAKIRKALTMALDRERIIEQNLNEMAISITGPFFRFSPSYDSQITPWSYNPDSARKILEEEGWIDIDGDGIREKVIEGQKIPFRFKLYYFVKSHSTKVIAEYIVTALKEIGIDCQIRGLDIADLSRQFDDKSFDAIFMGWKLGTPPEDPRQLWHSSGAKEKGSSNAVGFSNAKIDTIIDDLNYEYDRQKRISLYHEFHHIIHDEAPYTFLYTPKVRLLYREYVKNLYIPLERQDLIPGADIAEPNTQVIWLEETL